MSWREVFDPSRARLTRSRVLVSYSIAAGALASVLGLALGGCAGCGGQAPRDLQVTAWSPHGAIDSGGPIEIMFDRPAIAADEVGKPAAPDSVRLAPAAPWKGFWRDRQTLVVEASALAPSTRYQVALAGPLGARTGGFDFAFVNKPLAVEGVWGVDAQALAPDGNLPLSFNVPVEPADVADHCRLTGLSTIALAPTSSGAATNIALAPAQHLAPGASYTLTCAGLAGAGGNAPLDKPYTLALRARPPLSIVKFEPSGAAAKDVPADEVTLSITFSTPVAIEAARKAVSSVPAIPGLDQGYLSGDGTEYKVTADLETQTDYKVTVADLTDTFGQRLGTAQTGLFRTGDARPRLSMERGIFALEASAKGYPLWSRNVGAFAVECAQIPRDRLVQVVTTDMNYDAWGGNDDDKPIDWKAYKVAAKTATETTAGRNKWLLHELDLGDTCAGTPGARGVYLAEVRSDEIIPDPHRGWLTPRRNRVLANVTDLGVLVKVGTSSGLVWVTSLATGAPVGGARVAVYKPDGKQVYSDLTNADGLVKIPGSALLKDQKPTGDAPDPDSEGDWESFRSQRLIAVVEKGADTAVVDGNWSNGIQIWNFGVPEDRSGGASKIRGFIQSDRGLYRPGESVHFKGIAREVAEGRAPRVPHGGPVAVEVSDSRGQTVLSTSAKLSAFGGFAFDMDLGPEASTGDYFVAATVSGQVFREKFTVEEFRAATFEVAQRSAGAAPRPGERLAFELDARYLFGAPVGAAKVEWGLRKRPHPVRFDKWEEYTFSANPREGWWYEPSDDYGELVSDGAAVTDASGHLAIAARDPATAFDGPIDYILSTNVTDAADQTMGKSTVITAHKTAFYLGMHANEYVQAVGMPFGVNLVALAPDGARVATKAKLSVIRTVNTCAWTAVTARSYYHCDAREQVVAERAIDIAAGGSHTERIDPTEPGDYVIRAEATDAGGNAVVAASEVYVIGKGEAFWSGDEGARMTLVASKPSYQPGDVARLVPQTNLVKPTALVTIERDGVLDARVMRMASASEGIELAIADAWAPNVYASVAMVSGRHGAGDANRPMFKMGMTELKVSSADKQLDVAVALAQDHVRPGERVSGTITVSHHGEPVAAEVSLSAADEGVLSLIAYQTPNPMKTFYAAYGLGVDSATNWNRVARLADPESGDPDEGGDSRSSGDGQRVRSKFVASAYWAPMLLTDARGEIHFSFVAPDNLTAFRLMAVAADQTDRFGAGEQRLTVSKPLMAAPALPRFLRAGDAAAVGIVIHNQTDRSGPATVTAKASGAVLDGERQTIDVPANGAARVRFVAKASESAAATFEFSVALGKESDAVKVTLPIERPRTVEQRLVAEQTLGAGETLDKPLDISADVLRGESTLIITVDRTGMGDLAPSLRALVEYPYGCLEQTMSRFLPLVAAKDLAKSLDDPSLRGTKADQFVKAGIAKVVRHQQGDGLFSLWPQSQTYPHLAAYALWGLTVAQQAGETVPADVFDRGIAALDAWAQRPDALKPDGDAAVACMAAYVMALRGKPDASLVARLYAMRGALPRWGQAFLLRAIAVGKGDPAELAEVEALIAAHVVTAGGRATVHETLPGYDYELYMSSDARATAMTLAALLDADPKSPLIDPLAQGLLAMRQDHGAWGSTQENLWSLVALAQYARRTTAGATTTIVQIDGAQVAKQRLSGGDVATVRVPLASVKGGRVAVSADAGARVSVRVSEARIDAGAAAAHGFSIERAYLDHGGGARADFKAGDLVTVRLRVHADDAHRWVALVDPLPAGFEVVNAALASGGTDLAKPAAATGDPWSAPAHTWWERATWTHQDERDDRVQWFADDMRAGSYELTYQARATIDGTFTASPATIEAMYHPEVRGRTAQATVVVAP